MLRIHTYQSKNELIRAHPEIKTFTTVLQIPRGTSAEGVVTILRQRKAQGPHYIIGNFVWVPLTEPVPFNASASTPRCVCLQYIGDNGPCPKHGSPLTQRR